MLGDWSYLHLIIVLSSHLSLPWYKPHRYAQVFTWLAIITSTTLQNKWCGHSLQDDPKMPHGILWPYFGGVFIP